MKWYKGSLWASDGEIDECVFERDTENFLFYKDNRGRRVAKIASDYQWFRTKEEAVEYVRMRLKARVETAKTSLATTEKRLKQFEEKYVAQ